MIERIVFTGGGSAGHVTPNIALILQLSQQGSRISYIGSRSGMEHAIVKDLPVDYYGVSSGKLRRYFSWQNFLSPFKILLGIVQSFFILRKTNANILFSKGGFVAFPVVVAARLNRIPIVCHESDMTPGLANKLSYPFAKKICLTFSAAKNHFKNQSKLAITGTPIRESLLKGDKKKGLAFCQFTGDKPCLLILGGGQGAQSINDCVRACLGELLKQFDIIHLCGEGKVDQSFFGKKGYKQIEYAHDELADLFAASDMVISRSGANCVYEILALKKPHIFIPLPLKASRGDQIHNANYFVKRGVSIMIDDDKLTDKLLLSRIYQVFAEREHIIKKISSLDIESGTNNVINVLEESMR
jgi:UDP-N-acetylglucosamine--N-acetylmuramyl-(pentapeptide) pyrophosphoryl-undecaprenol N-acetylglucosamine transferase